MKPIRVNADYEIELFSGRAAPQMINQSIEFLALYLQDRPLHTIKKYNEAFIRHVEELSGISPAFVTKGDFDNWWGELKNKELEKKLNSKIWSQKFCPESQIIQSINELKIEKEKEYLAKNPFGMSGQNFLVFRQGDEEKVQKLLKENSILIIEPLYKRIHDFSHYVFCDGNKICYQNLVDENFQYKGTIFRLLEKPTLKSLSFYEDIDEKEWSIFELNLELIIKGMTNDGAQGGYSVDSFIYEEKGKLKIKSISEVNYRKTMGLMAWLLSQKYKNSLNWSALVLGRFIKKHQSFEQNLKTINSISNCYYLSPGDTRFEIFLIFAESEKEGKVKFEKLKSLLPDCQFSIKI